MTYDFENPLELARRRRVEQGLSLIDLSDGNPTAHGLSLDWGELADDFAAYLKSRVYKPDSRGLAAAREGIAGYYAGRTPALKISPENVFVVSSTSEAYGLLLSLLCRPGEAVLEPEITYPIFELIAENHAARRLQYSFPPDGFAKSEEIFMDEDLFGQAKALFCISPHNPTGRVADRESQFLKFGNFPVIVDEVFAEFTAEGCAVPPLGALFTERPVFHLNGISKMCGLPDFKIAWIALNDCARERYARSLEFLNDLYLNASYPIQSLVPGILPHAAEYRQLVQKRIQTNLAIADEVLGTCSFISCHHPQAGATLFPRVPAGTDEESFMLSLLERGVSVHPGYYYNWERDCRLVLSLLLRPEFFAEGLGILRHHLAGTFPR
jgi:alanine-synthesizing transaminase